MSGIQEDDLLLSQIAPLLGDNRFKLFQRYLDKEISDRKNLTLNSKDWADFKEQRGIVKGIGVARDLLQKRIDRQIERAKEEAEEDG